MILRSKNEKIVTAGMLLAVGLILPFATAHGMGLQGNILLPMHIPVFLIGLLCGPLLGGVCGVLLPIMNGLLTGMPALYPTMPMMACELAAYGLICGLLYCKTPLGKYKVGVYASLLGGMVGGRVVYGLALELLLLVDGGAKAATVWAALVAGLPGIVIQLLLVPGVLFAVERFLHREQRNAIESAKNLIAREKACCVVIRKGRIVNIETGMGIRPLIAMYEQGLLQDAVVVDKIVGKAAAMLLVLGGARACHGRTVSQSAVDYLRAHRIAVTYEECVPHIINRTGDGICPMEQTVMDLNDPQEALEAVKNKLAEPAANKK